MEECHPVLTLFYSHAEVNYSRQPLCKFCQFVVVCRKKNRGFSTFLSLKVFYDRPGYAETVICRGPPANFVEYDKTPVCRITEDISGLNHFHHKGTLSSCKLVTSSYSGKNPVYYPNLCALGRNEGSHVCHDTYESSHPQVCRFSRHIGTGYYCDPFTRDQAKRKIIWSKWTAA